MGGGFEIYDFDTFARYAPNPLDVHAAHSIYFQVLGESTASSVLFLFMSIGAFTWMAASDGKRKAKGLPGLEWVAPLMDMMKVSMVGYGVGGAFLSLAYFDVPYYVMVIIVATRAVVAIGLQDTHRRGTSGRVQAQSTDSGSCQWSTTDSKSLPVKPLARTWRRLAGAGRLCEAA